MNQKIQLRVNRYVALIKNSPLYLKTSLLTRDIQNWLEHIKEQQPTLALFGVLLVMILSVMAINDINAETQELMRSWFNADDNWNKDHFILIGNLLSYALCALPLFFVARVPFYSGVLLGLVVGLLNNYSYRYAILPFGMETALLAYIAFFQWETVKVWAVKWWQQKKALKNLGYTVLVLIIFWVVSNYLKEIAFVILGLLALSIHLFWLIPLVLVLYFWLKGKKPPPETSLFDATLEPKKYFNNEGVVLGWCHCNIPEKKPKQHDEDRDELMPYQKKPHVVRYKTDKHFLSIMPNRSGKGRSQIIPNLLQLADWSCLVIDPKGENALVTAQWRKQQGHEIVIFNPYGLWAEEFKKRGFHTFQTFNPLLNLDPNSDRFIGDVDTLADALIYNTGGDSHWSEGAKGLVALLIMYLVTEESETATFRRLRELIAGGYDSLSVAFSLMEISPSDLVRENVGRFKHKTKETESIFATAETQTNIFRNKTLCNALEGEAFNFEAMKNKKMTVYLILPAEYLVTQARFLRLILLSAMSQFTRTEEGEHRIMVFLDEFANLGQLQIIEQGAALISGYGVTLWPFVQNLSQLEKLYPDNWEVFIANAAAITVANVNDVKTAEYFSKRGGKTIKNLFSWSSSTTNSGYGANASSSSTSGHNVTQTVLDILPVEDMYNQQSSNTYVFFEGKAPPLVAIKWLFLPIPSKR